MTYDPNPAYGQEQRRSGPRWYSVVAFLVISGLLFLNAAAMLGNLEANERIADTNERIEHLTKISTCIQNVGVATDGIADAQKLRLVVLENCMDKEVLENVFDFDD